jgi:lipopolysaccharide export system permease protein
MKVLNKYILKEHIPPFLFSIFIITFILILETIPKIIDMVIDKNISYTIVLELVFFNLAWMIALSVPMAVLVATLLAFGRLTSDSEIVAIKSSGINLIKILIPLLIAAAFLTAAMIQFSDKILPRLNFEARVLTGDIQTMRPALTFRPGVFITDISGYIILIDKIDHVTSDVENVRITDTKDPNHPRITVAKSGNMKFIDNGQTIQFTLFDGEIHILDTKDPLNYRKLDFKEHVINVGGVASELKRTGSNFKTDREMNIAEMQDVVDRTRETIIPFYSRIEKTVDNHLDYIFSKDVNFTEKTPLTDSAALAATRADITGIATRLKRDISQVEEQQKLINKYKIEIYKKYSIPAASFAFVLIGAPLAILSRRGGMGVAVTVSLLIFTAYWGFLIGGEDISDRGLLSPFWAMWSANILCGLAGLYLLVKVISEKPIFSFFRRL